MGVDGGSSGGKLRYLWPLQVQLSPFPLSQNMDLGGLESDFALD